MKLPFFSKSKDPVADFWDYFVAIAPDIVAAGRPINSHINGIGKKLDAIHKRIAWQIGPAEGAWSLEISADGVHEMVPHVMRIVEAAPEIPGWKVHAFRQRVGVPTTLEMNGMAFDPHKIFFTSLVEGDKVDLVFYVDGLNALNREPWIGAIFIYLDSLVGEFDVMTKIGAIDFLPLSQAGDRSQLRSFDQVPAVVDSL